MSRRRCSPRSPPEPARPSAGTPSCATRGPSSWSSRSTTKRPGTAGAPAGSSPCCAPRSSTRGPAPSWPSIPLPGPYFFVADGVLTYLPQEQVTAALARLAARFPGALIALDTYPRSTFERQHQLAARKNLARWQWAVDDPRTLERLGLHVAESATITRPPAALRRQLPARLRYLLPLARPVLDRAIGITLFRAEP